MQGARRAEPPVDLFFNRVMFPIRDRRGRSVSFGGRILGDGQPKYVNGPETALFSKRRNLYGLDLAREGVFRGSEADRLRRLHGRHRPAPGGLHRRGRPPRHRADRGADCRPSGRSAPSPCSASTATQPAPAPPPAPPSWPCRMLSPERTLRFVTLPAGEDPDTLIRKGGPRAFQAALDAAQPLSDALFSLIIGGKVPESPEGRAALRNRLVAAAQTIPDKALAAEFRRSLLDRFFSPPSAPGLRGRPARHPRPEPDREAAQGKRARILLAICIHP
jgi:DNA primase